MSCAHCSNSAQQQCSDCKKLFCGQACFELVCGDLQNFIKSPLFGPDLFATMLSKYSDEYTRMQFIDVTLNDATEDQRIKIMEWFYTHPEVIRVMDLREDVTGYLFNQAITYTALNILFSLSNDKLKQISDRRKEHALQLAILTKNKRMLWMLFRKLDIRRNQILYAFSLFPGPWTFLKSLEMATIISKELNANGQELFEGFAQLFIMLDSKTHERSEHGTFLFKALYYALRDTNRPIIDQPTADNKKIKR